jgi:DNA-directed RNA polymerase II subunit RPB3
MFSQLNKTKLVADFEVHNVDVSVVNAIRRTIISEVPTVGFAFDPNQKENDIKVLENSGALHNEFLCHRLSLIPIYLNKQEIAEFEPTQYSFVLKVKNEGTTMMDVTSKDIQIYNSQGSKYDNQLRNRLFPPYLIDGEEHHILITKLKPNLYNEQNGDGIYIKATASKNVGSVHSRWSPVSKCCYHNIVDEELAKKVLDKKIDENKDENLNKEEITKRFELLDKQRYFIRNKYDEPSAFKFEIESECALEPTEIFEQGIEHLILKLQNFAENVENDNGIFITQQANMHYIKIDNEGHTLGNLIQSMFYNYYIRTEDPVLTYIGYYQPHPLENHIIIKLTGNIESLKDIIVKGVNRLIKDLTDMKEEWNKFVSGV